MEGASKNISFIIIAVIGTFLVVYGAIMLFSPSYREKVQRPRRRFQKQPIVLDKIGGFNLGPGRGMSYEESGQLFSPYASGQNPNLVGHNDQVITDTPDPEGEADFFEMFME